MMNQWTVKLRRFGLAASKFVGLGTVGALGAYTVYSSFYSVAPGCRAIMFSRLDGIKDKIYPEGTHTMIPWLERPFIYDIRSRPYLVESTSGSHDLQMVNIGLRVLFYPKVDELPRIHRHLGEDYDERVLPSIIHETLKAVIAQYNASQLLTQREGEAKSARLIGRAVSNNPAFIALRHIEASKETAQTLADAENKVYMSSDNLLIDLKSLKIEDAKGSKK